MKQNNTSMKDYYFIVSIYLHSDSNCCFSSYFNAGASRTPLCFGRSKS